MVKITKRTTRSRQSCVDPTPEIDGECENDERNIEGIPIPLVTSSEGMIDMNMEANDIVNVDDCEANVNEISQEKNDKHESMTAPKSRLIIERLELHNFKSYAGTRVIGPFHKRFTSVVGPNGSGKSNVIDAMLFVFGKRASKIRLKKVSELIHNSESHSGLTSASVSVHFAEITEANEESDEYEVVEGSQLVVCRTAFKNSTSKYTVNGVANTYSGVTALLRAKEIDLDHNRFLILQGEVEMISLMKPKASTPHETGILEYLEDIIGSIRYVDQIEHVNDEVETLNESRSYTLNRVKVVEKERDALESSKCEAEKYLQIEHDLTQCKSKLYQVYCVAANDNVTKIDSNVKVLQDKLTYEQEKHASIEAEYKSKQNEICSSKKEAEILDAELKKCQNEYGVLERKDVQLQEAIKHSKTKRSKLKAKLKREEAKIVSSTKSIDELVEERPSLEQSKAQIEQRKVVAENKRDKAFERVRGKTEHLRLEMEAKQKHLIPLRQRVNSCQRKSSTIESELAWYNDKATNASTQVHETQQAMSTISEEIQQQQNACRCASDEMKMSETRLNAAKNELHTTTNEIDVMETTLKQHRYSVVEANNVMSASRNRGTVLQALMTAKQRGELCGIHGRLGDLGSIDQQYDVAISTACGALNNIVVDTIETAQKCANFLRKNKIGSATFIILQKIQYLQTQIEAMKNTPENVSRLIDLVKPTDAIFRPAFYFALRDTLVAQNLDQAVRIGYNAQRRHRVVSLNGDLIDASGTMSGGGNRVARGGMSASHAEHTLSSAQIKALEVDIQSISAKLKQFQTKRSDLRVEIEKLTQTIQQCNVIVSKCKLEIASLSHSKAQLQTRLKTEEAALAMSSDDVNAIDELKKKLSAASILLDKAKANAQNFEDEVSSIENAILEAGGSQLKQSVVDVEKLCTELDDAIKTLTRCDVHKENAEKAIVKARKDVSSCSEELSSATDEMKAAENELEELMNLAAELLEAMEAAQTLVDEKNAELKTLSTSFDKLKSKVNVIRTVELDIQQQIEDFQRSRVENENKANHWKRKACEIVEKLAQQTPLSAQKSSTEQVDGDIETKLLNDEAVHALSKNDLEVSIGLMEEELSSLSPNMSAIDEYTIKHNIYLERINELDSITTNRDEKRLSYDTLRKQRLDEFMSGFRIITMKLKEMYQMLTLGGDAELELVDTLDPFREGIIFSVRPPKKSWKNISNLSGGEKTLSSLALVFALHYYRPTPLYVMDEIDAALDFKNVSIVANYIKERTRDAQFIIISLRNNMFECADRLVGIYKTDNASKSITINPHSFVLEDTRRDC